MTFQRNRLRKTSEMGENSLAIHEKVEAYYGSITGEHHRYRSWEHCYKYFHRSTREEIAVDRDHDALQLGFELHDQIANFSVGFRYSLRQLSCTA